MAGPRPDDNYNSVPGVEPSTGMPSDTLSVRASPENFGGQIGQALQSGGQKIEQGADSLMQVQMQKLGLANEHAATAAEMQLAVQGGQIYDKYKSLEGLDASNSKDAAVQDYLNLSNKIRSSLGNPAAQRAYDQMATRRMSFTIQDMNSYSADQTKKAYRDGNKAAADLSLDRLSRYEVATNPSQFNFEMANVIHNANAEYTAPTYGHFQTVPATTDPKTGLLKFEDTSQGRVAQADYDNFINSQKDKAYTNSVNGIAFDAKRGNINNAVDFLADHEKDMSPGTYAKLSAHLAGPYGNEQARSISETVLNKYNGMYQGGSQDDIPRQIKELIPGAVISSTTRTPEQNKKVGGVSDSMHLSGQAADVVLPLGTTASDLKAQLASKGITPTEFKDEGTHVHIGWGSKNGVGMTPMLSGGVHQSQADFLSDHLPQMIQETRTEAASQGQDTTGQDRAVQRLETRVNEVRSAQAGEAHSLRDSLLQKIMDPKNPMVNPSMLEYGDVDTRNKWVRYQTLDTFGASAMQRQIASNAFGRSNTYGTDFYSHYTDLLTGKVKTDELQDYFGGDKSPISNTGIRVLRQTEEDLTTPQGQAFRAAEAKYLDTIHGQITGSKVFPGINPAILKADFDKQLMDQIPQIEAKKADLVRQGKNPTDMFNPDSTDYVGKNVKPVELDKAIKALVTSGTSNTAPAQNNPAPLPSHIENTGATSYKTFDDVGLAMQAGKISPAEAHKIMNDKFGGFAPNTPRAQ